MLIRKLLFNYNDITLLINEVFDGLLASSELIHVLFEELIEHLDILQSYTHRLKQEQLILVFLHWILNVQIKVKQLLIELQDLWLFVQIKLVECAEDIIRVP